MMDTAAHRLFEAMNMELEKGADTRYPASRHPLGSRYRYWATAVDEQLQFGLQLRSKANDWPPEAVNRLETFGFEPRPNGREYFLGLPAEIEEAKLLASAIIALCERLELESLFTD